LPSATPAEASLTHANNRPPMSLTRLTCEQGGHEQPVKHQDMDLRPIKGAGGKTHCREKSGTL